MDAKATINMENLPRDAVQNNSSAIKDILVPRKENLINSYYGIWARKQSH